MWWGEARDVVATAEFQSQRALLQETLDLFRRTHGFGRGMAAPQIGYLR
jgi:peptide deformylase